MFKRIRKYYWKKRDAGKGKQVKMLALILSLLCLVFMTLTVVVVSRSVKAIFLDQEKQVAQAGSETYFEESDYEDYEEDDSEDDYDEDDDESLLDRRSKSEEETKLISSIDYKNMDSFLAFMSDESYTNLKGKIDELKRDKNITSAKRLDYQIVDEKAYLVTSFVLLSDGSVLKVDYQMKNGAFAVTETQYDEAAVNRLKEEAEKAAQEELLKAQEEEREKIKKEEKKKQKKKKKSKKKHKKKKRKKNS